MNMTKIKRITIVAAAAIILTAAALLILPLFGGSGPMIVSAGANDLMKGIKDTDENTDVQLPVEFASSYSNFSVELFKKCAADGGNSFISPVSVYLTLGLTANGADGTTRTAFEKVIGQSGLTIDRMNEACKKLMADYADIKNTTKFKIANSIWYRNDFKADKQFLQNNADHYGAGIYSENFANPDTPKLINKWINENTAGKLDGNIDKIDGNTVMYIVDAFYFEAKWINKFKSIPDAAFYLSDDKTVQAKFMKFKNDVRFGVTKDESFVVLPYKDGRFAFLAVMPEKADIAAYIRSLNDTSLSNLVSKAHESELTLTMPKFRTEFTVNLDSALKQMGLGIAFDETNADFSKMGTSPIKGNTFIGSVDHKTFIEIDEEGTKAGGWTISFMATKSLPQSLTFNKPFIYAIMDLESNLPVFMGVLANPNKN